MTYIGLKESHSVSSVEDDGLFVVLEDGSRWQVYEGFTFRSNAWIKGEMIMVKTNKNPENPFTLINVHKNDQVEAMLLGEG